MNCWPCVRSLTHSPDAVIHSPAAMVVAAFLTGNDPVASGYVSSLNRPGGNATGVSFLAGELIPAEVSLGLWAKGSQ